ncbi:type III secretion system outer membrane ring subunit SctC [Paraburkholderia strydomiana]|uniref:type III secretion system outer membrane ring subunit SctC n=1 Tax=Paraburkholderia strydomiana TaxID=1245417 RepID=UPI00285C357A|nr:type III secretion system outer membrane ring subunit SctC [Paraburkholderia strydomiana]MDR7009570.1 type III secretion protein C [Paraburkholderia strydomiana]
MKSKLGRCAIGAALLLCLTTAHAAPIKWRPGLVQISVESKDVKDVLSDFAASQGIIISIAPNIQGTVSGRFNLPPRKFIDTMAATFGFVWFYDGSVLSISAANDVSTRVINLDFAGTENLRQTLKQIGLETDRFPIVYDPVQGVALVTGPSRLLSLVSDVAARIDQNANRRTGSEVRVYPLKNGWADDHKVVIDGKTVIVPGVASVLSSLYHPQNDSDKKGNSRGATPDVTPSVRPVDAMADVRGGTSGGSPYPDNAGVNPPLPGLFGAPLPNAAGPVGAPSQGAHNGNDASGRGAPSTAALPDGAGSLPVIIADPRTNSVLVRDLPQRVDQYKPLIDRLDVKRRMIEIEANIIQINDNALKQIGVDWRAHNSHVDFQTGNGVTSANSFNGQLNPTFTGTDANGNTIANVTPAGLSLTAVVGDAGRYLLARVNALEQDDLARVDASPKVATLDNVEAVMDNKTRFFVKVAGFTSSDLFSVSVGNTLRVLPMVTDDEGKTQIKLQVHVEDGQIVLGQTTDQIPQIATSEINTEAVVTEGQSLLIAGYRIDNQTNGESGVPVLSKIPFLGGLFRYRQKQNSHMERLVLLSPRVIEF